MKYLLLTSTSTLALLAAVGCAPSVEGSKETAADKPATSTSSAPAVEETSAPAVEVPSEPPPEDPGIAKVGATQWFTYEDGLKVQVTKLTKFKVGQYAAGAKPGSLGVIATVTMKNSTNAVVDSTLTSVKLAAGPNGDQAEEVYDSENNADGFSGKIPKGRSKTAKYAFAVTKAQMAKLVFEVAPTWDHDSSFFEGSVK